VQSFNVFFYKTEGREACNPFAKLFIGNLRTQNAARCEALDLVPTCLATKAIPSNKQLPDNTDSHTMELHIAARSRNYINQWLFITIMQTSPICIEEAPALGMNQGCGACISQA
jgi:hypothetical protein